MASITDKLGDVIDHRKTHILGDFLKEVAATSIAKSNFWLSVFVDENITFKSLFTVLSFLHINQVGYTGLARRKDSDLSHWFLAGNTECAFVLMCYILVL